MRVQQSSTFSEDAKSIAFEGGCKERAKYALFLEIANFVDKWWKADTMLHIIEGSVWNMHIIAL